MPVKEILQRSGTVAGSLYHHFPGGKDDVALAALESAGSEVEDLLQMVTDRHALVAAVDRLFLLGTERLVDSRFRQGCAVGNVAAEAVGVRADIDQTIRRVLDAWTDALAAAIRRSGRSRSDAQRLAILVLSLYEGAMLLARSRRDRGPLETARVHASSLLR